MHAETLSYMLHQLPLNNLLRIKQTPAPAGRPSEQGLIDIPGGPTALGRSRADASTFGWDNEFERHVVEVPPFTIDRYKVTNRQFLEFVRAGGYQSRELWSDDGWRWKQDFGIEHPLLWRCDAGMWRYRAFFEELPFPLDWPVYVSHAEAAAYSAWTGKRLPTEAEWHRAAYGGTSDEEPAYPWGEQTPGGEHGYLGMRRWDPSPVNAYPQGRSSFGVGGHALQRLGMDLQFVCSVPRFPCLPVLSRLFRKFL